MNLEKFDGVTLAKAQVSQLITTSLENKHHCQQHTQYPFHLTVHSFSFNPLNSAIPLLKF